METIDFDKILGDYNRALSSEFNTYFSYVGTERTELRFRCALHALEKLRNRLGAEFYIENLPLVGEEKLRKIEEAFLFHHYIVSLGDRGDSLQDRTYDKFLDCRSIDAKAFKVCTELDDYVKDVRQYEDLSSVKKVFAKQPSCKEGLNSVADLLCDLRERLDVILTIESALSFATGNKMADRLCYDGSPAYKNAVSKCNAIAENVRRHFFADLSLSDDVQLTHNALVEFIHETRHNTKDICHSFVQMKGMQESVKPVEQVRESESLRNDGVRMDEKLRGVETASGLFRELEGAIGSKVQKMQPLEMQGQKMTMGVFADNDSAQYVFVADRKENEQYQFAVINVDYKFGTVSLDNANGIKPEILESIKENVQNWEQGNLKVTLTERTKITEEHTKSVGVRK